MRFIGKQRAVIAYLNSDAFRSRQDAQTSLVSIPVFVRMIEMGFITDDSQEGLIKVGYNAETRLHYDIQERAYVLGIMRKDHGKQFVKNINIRTDKVAFIMRIDPTAYFDAIFQRELQPDIVLGRSKTARTPELLAAKDFYEIGSIQLVGPIASYPEIATYDEEVVSVQVFDPVYGRNARSVGGLYRDILNCLA
jgi:hypothetical protein